MDLRLLILGVPAAAGLVACSGSYLIGGPPDGGPSALEAGALPGSGADASGATGPQDSGASSQTPCVGYDNSYVCGGDGAGPVTGQQRDGDAVPVDAVAAGDGSGVALLSIQIDGGLGGFCAASEAGLGADAADDGGAVDASDGDSGANAGDAAVMSPTASCGCSRRTSRSAIDCPEGLGEYAVTTVDANGGAVSLEGRQGIFSGVAAEVTFPPDAFAAPTAITLIETALLPPTDLLDWSPVYLVEPRGLALTSPAAVRLPWGNLPTELVSDLSIWFSPDGICFTRLSDSYTNAGFEQGSIAQLGFLIVGTPRTASTATCP